VAEAGPRAAFVARIGWFVDEKGRLVVPDLAFARSSDRIV